MRLLLALLTSLALPALAQSAPVSPSYSVTGSIAGPDGSWDYARVDPDARRLYVARADAVTAVDLASGTALPSWGKLARGHAVVPLPGHHLLVTSGNDNSVRFFDDQTGAQLKSIAVGKKPDAAIYDAGQARAYVMNSDGGTISVVDTAGMTVVRTIPVKSALEYAALGKNGTLFVNDEDANEVEVVDLVAGKTVASIAMPGCEGPTGLGYDAPHDRLVSACANGKAAIIDARTRKMVRLVETGKGADAVIMDEARRLAFIPCGKDGVLDILALDAPGGVARVGSVTTEVGARTGALDPATGILYLPTARFGAPTADGKRPAPIAGSFHILIVKPAA